MESTIFSLSFLNIEILSLTLKLGGEGKHFS